MSVSSFPHAGTLITAGLSFVAGLAWKDFFREAFDLGPISAHLLVNQLVYALVVSLISVVAICLILRAVDKMAKVNYAQRVAAFDESMRISAAFRRIDSVLGVTREWNDLTEKVAKRSHEVKERLKLRRDSDSVIEK